VCAFLGALIGSSKGQAAAGFFLGLLLGVIGLIIVVVLEAGRQGQEFGSGSLSALR
jgi:hypothetical protein